MAETREKGWESPLYSQTNAEMWVRAFEKMYLRATEIFSKICRKSRKDVIDLASKSQSGWEIYKKIIKEIYKTDKLYNDDTRRIFSKVYTEDIENTIRAFSSFVILELTKMRHTYKLEYNYLTGWYRGVI